jgi:hypothetical protein
VKSRISQEFPWIWGYYSQKQITLGASILDSIPIEEPDWDDTLYALKALELANGAENLPFSKLFVGQTQTELNARAAHTAELRALEAGNDPNAAAVAHCELVQEAMSICDFQLYDKAKRVLITDVTKATSMIVEQRLVSRQFRNDDDELHADQNLEIAKRPVCKDFNTYVKAKLGSRWAVYDKELKEAHIASEKRAHKSNELSQRCLDAMALLEILNLSQMLKKLSNVKTTIAAS